MTDEVATVLDDINVVKKIGNAELIKMTMVSENRPIDVLVPVEAAAKIVLQLLDIFQHDDRNLQTRRNLSDPEFSASVSLLRVKETEVVPPDTPAEPFHLDVLLEGGLALHFSLGHEVARTLASQSHEALAVHQRRPPLKPN